MEQLSISNNLSSTIKKGTYISAAIAEREDTKSTISSEPTDGALAQQMLAGDERGFEQLVYRYYKPLFSYIYRFLGNREQSYDVLQKVFLKFYLSLPELKMNQPFNPWLFQVAYHYCIDEFRVRNRKPALFFSELYSLSGENELSPLETLPDTDPLPETVAEDHDLQHQLMQALQVLPANYRSIVLLRYMAQLRFSEISQMLDIPTATVKTYFHRAKPLLRKALEEILAS